MLLVERRLRGRPRPGLASARLVLVAMVTLTLVFAASVARVAFIVFAHVIALATIAVSVAIPIALELGAPVQLVHVPVVALLVASVHLPERDGHIFAQKVVEVLQNLDRPSPIEQIPMTMAISTTTKT